MANEHSQIVPSMQPTAKVADFKFWCQKVLPLVYDDSLSYYEVLNKMVVYLNQVIDNINADIDNVAELKDDFLLLQTYVNNFFDDIDQLVTYTERAEAAQSAAATSAINAASSASNAATSASNAASSSGSAAASALSSMTAKDAAVAAKTAAEAALANAQTAANNAAASATAAGNSANAASGSAVRAAASAASALQNFQLADAARVAAQEAESNAEESANSAADSADAAAASAASADGAKAQAMIAEVESTTATEEHKTGEYFRINGILYKATSDIEIGDTISTETNCEIAVLSNDVYILHEDSIVMDERVDAIEEKIDAAFENKTIENVEQANFDDGAENIPVKALTLDVVPYQSGSGTPTPSNVRNITGYSSAAIVDANENICGGQAMLDCFEFLGLDMSRVNEDADGRYYELYSHTASNSKTYIPRWYFKPNTRYTFILRLKSASTNPNIRIFYTDGTTEGIFNVETTVKTLVYVSAANKTVSRIGGYYSNANNAKLYVDGSGVFEGVLTANDFKASTGKFYNVAFPDGLTAYGGTLDVTHGILTINRWGEYVNPESVTYYNTTAAGLSQSRYFPSKQPNIPSETNIYRWLSNSFACYPAASTPSEYSFMRENNGGNSNVWVYLPSAFNATALVREYFTSNQVFIVYQLAAPIVYNLTPTEVQTILETNNIFTNVGNIKLLTYRAMNSYGAEVYLTQEMIAPVLDEMIADTALVANDFRIVNNVLYRITTNIASGAALIPGTNCTAVSITEILKSLLS